MNTMNIPTSYHSRMLSLGTTIRDAIAANRNAFFICLLIFVTLFFTEFADYMMRIDEEVAARRASAMHITKGRWGTWMIESLLIRPLNPVFSMFVFGALLTASFLLFCNLLQIKRTGFILASFVLFSAFPTWYYLIEFKGTILANGFAVFFASLAGALFNARVPFARLLFVLLLVAAISIYQSSILITLVMVTASLVSGARHEEHEEERAEEIRPFLIAMTRLILLSVSSFVVYLGVWKILLYVFNFSPRYITAFLEFEKLIDRPFTVLGMVIMQAISFYSGTKVNFAGMFPFAGVLFLIGCIAFFYRPNRYQSSAFKSCVFILLLSLPVLMNFLSGGRLPIRTMLAVPFVYWFFVVLALQSDVKILRMTAKVLTLVVALQFFQLAAFSSFSHKFVSAHDQLLAGQLYQRIVAEIDDFDRSKTYPVDFVGSYSFPNHASYLEIPRHGSVTGLSIFGFGEQWKRAIRYMELLGMGHFRMINNEERARISDRVASMTHWPDRGSVRNIDDIIVVKFGPINQPE